MMKRREFFKRVGYVLSGAIAGTVVTEIRGKSPKLVECQGGIVPNDYDPRPSHPNCRCVTVPESGSLNITIDAVDSQRFEEALNAHSKEIAAILERAWT